MFVSVDLATGNARLLSVTPRHPFFGALNEGRRVGVLLSFALGMVVFAYFMWGQVWLQ